jgi:hypothetical protein
MFSALIESSRIRCLMPSDWPRQRTPKAGNLAMRDRLEEEKVAARYLAPVSSPGLFACFLVLRLSGNRSPSLSAKAPE